MKCPFCGIPANDLSAHAESCTGSPAFLNASSDSFGARRMCNRVAARLENGKDKRLVTLPVVGGLTALLALAVFWPTAAPQPNSQPIVKAENPSATTVVEIADGLREPAMESYAAYRLKDSRKYLEAYP